MIDTIIFDLGNVIVNYDFNIALNRLFENSEKDKNYIIKVIHNYGLIKKFDKGELSEIEFYEKVKNDLQLNINFEKFKTIWAEIFTENEEIKKLVSILKDRDFYLLLLSDTNKIHFQYIEKKYGIINLFDEVLLSYETGFLKTEKGSFDYLKRRLKTNPENCIFIDDKKENLIYAKNMGVNCILFKNYEELVFEL